MSDGAPMVLPPADRPDGERMMPLRVMDRPIGHVRVRPDGEISVVYDEASVMRQIAALIREGRIHRG